ncbi:rCG41052 [Rattus norvegicus]|uniref:RCG41052 n=1 Tax=Rattus norvegicus TaxID=10116 RepID=A6K245_RAT|nr:rCG41052 [Rattus norvegicus]
MLSSLGAGEMDRWAAALNALPEVRGWIPSSHMEAHTLQLRDLTSTHRQTCRQKFNVCKIKINRYIQIIYLLYTNKK